MQANRTKAKRAVLAMGLGAVLCALGAGCGKKEEAPPAAAKAAAKPGSTPAPAEGGETNRLGRAPEFLSYFSTNDARDPFNPKAKPKADAAETAAQAAAQAETELDQLTKALQSSVSVWGVPGNLVAVVHGVLLEEKKENVVSVAVGGAPRRVRVKPVRITTTQVQLEVLREKGAPQVVTLLNAR